MVHHHALGNQPGQPPRITGAQAEVRLLRVQKVRLVPPTDGFVACTAEHNGGTERPVRVARRNVLVVARHILAQQRDPRPIQAQGSEKGRLAAQRVLAMSVGTQDQRYDHTDTRVRQRSGQRGDQARPYNEVGIEDQVRVRVGQFAYATVDPARVSDVRGADQLDVGKALDDLHSRVAGSVVDHHDRVGATVDERLEQLTDARLAVVRDDDDRHRGHAVTILGSVPLPRYRDPVRILLIAPTVNKDDVGEAWVAYQWADLLSRRFDVTLLTYRKRRAPSITEQVPRARVIEWLEPPGLGRFERFNSLLKPGYLAFDVHARRWIRDAERRGEHFDVAHQVGPVAMRYPSPLRAFSIPYIVGPIGGSLDSPPGFQDGDTGPWYQRLRAMDGLRIQHDPSLRRSYEHAAVVLGIAEYVREFLDTLTLRRFEVMSDTGLVAMPSADPPRIPSTFSDAEPLRLLFVGRVIRTKGARDLVAAMAHLQDAPVELDVVGDGFDAATCRELSEELGVTGKVHFHGWLSKEAVEGFYRQAHVFAFPSYREPGGTVVFEAMGHSLPLIVCDRGGPGAAVDSSCAVALDAKEPDQLARDLATAVRRFVADPSLVTTMGSAARLRLDAVGMWPSKIDRIATLYEEVAASRV